jgi:hypothetical protein
VEKKSSGSDSASIFTSDESSSGGSGLPLARAIAGRGYRGLTETDSAIVGRNARVRDRSSRPRPLFQDEAGGGLTPLTMIADFVSRPASGVWASREESCRQVRWTAREL